VFNRYVLFGRVHIPDFAKSSLFNLVVRQLNQSNPELLTDKMGEIDIHRNAYIPPELMRDTLGLIWADADPVILLAIGQGVRDAQYDPMWHAAVRSVCPSVFFDKWRRFEVFGHSRNRLHIEQVSETSASFHRYTVDGGVPTAPENLMICGLVMAILEEIGCKDLCCEMPLEDGALYSVYRSGQFSMPAQKHLLMTGSWTMDWRECVPSSKSVGAPCMPAEISIPQSCDTRVRKSLEVVVQLLMLDVSRQWKIDELARASGMSKRSLQRRLKDVELSFSELVRMVRIRESCRLLKDPNTPITTIGFCSGFSDSAHFSRDFRASTGMTPSDYRAVSLGL